MRSFALEGDPATPVASDFDREIQPLGWSGEHAARFRGKVGELVGRAAEDDTLARGLG